MSCPPTQRAYVPVQNQFQDDEVDDEDNNDLRRGGTDFELERKLASVRT